MKERVENDNFAKALGIELQEVRTGYAKVRMPITPLVLNGDGACQGGALFTLADFAFATATNHCQPLTLTLNASITYLRPVREGYVYAEATEVFTHARIPFIEVRLTNDAGELVAVFTSSGYRKKAQQA